MWFNGTPAIDGEIAARFGAAIEHALQGRLDHLACTPQGALALCLLLDQMTRNAYRGTPRAFAGDRRARRIARTAIARGFDRRLPPGLRGFLYMPLHHSESVGDQNRSIGLLWQLRGPAKLQYAVEHRDVVARFGRFPHRNAVLGRPSSAEESAFLLEPGSRF